MPASSFNRAFKSFSSEVLSSDFSFLATISLFNADRLALSSIFLLAGFTVRADRIFFSTIIFLGFFPRLRFSLSVGFLIHFSLSHIDVFVLPLLDYRLARCLLQLIVSQLNSYRES